MSLPLIITPEAEIDLAEAKSWYDQQKTGLGEELLERVEEAINRILRIPLGATEVYPSVRRVMVRRFPYNILYRVDADQIAVIAVYHSNRDPSGWQKRVS